MIVGADGLHSNVRRLAFGPEKKFENHLGYFVAAFEAPGYRPRDELTYIMYTRPGRQIARFSLRKDRTLVLFIFRADAVPDQPPNDLEGRKSFLNRIYGNAGWECSNILGALDLVDDLYFDTVSQIQIEPWSKGRVILIGDAAACVSLLAGEGTGLAMTEAYLLAGELARAGEDYPLAFRNYELKLRNFVDRKQKSALNFASFFAPRISRSLWLRDQAIRLLRIRPLAYLLAGRSLKDDFILPEYESDR